jgi:hypothetical protein
MPIHARTYLDGFGKSSEFVASPAMMKEASATIAPKPKRKLVPNCGEIEARGRKNTGMKNPIPRRIQYAIALNTDLFGAGAGAGTAASVSCISFVRYYLIVPLLYRKRRLLGTPRVD